MDSADGLCKPVIVIHGHADFSHHTIGGEPSFDLLLGRDEDRGVAFHHSLAGKRVSLFNILRRQPQCASAADASLRHPDRASTTTSLPATGLTDVDARETRSVGQQGVGGDSNRLWVIVESEGDGVLHGLE